MVVIPFHQCSSQFMFPANPSVSTRALKISLEKKNPKYTGNRRKAPPLGSRHPHSATFEVLADVIGLTHMYFRGRGKSSHPETPRRHMNDHHVVLAR
jgi:hypothetical protein